jgi:hypothetical protein
VIILTANKVIISEKMTFNEIHYNPATSTYLSVVCLALKSRHTQNMLMLFKGIVSKLTKDFRCAKNVAK